MLKSFAGGLLMTLVLAVLVPLVCNEYVMPELDSLIGDRSFLMITSDVLVNLLMYLVVFGFMGVLGGTMIYRTCGVFGVLGLIAAYAVLGDVSDALIPVLMLILSMIVFKTIQIKKERRNGCSGGK